MKINCIFILAGLMVLQSCVVLSPKKYKSILAQRDSLQTRSTFLENQVATLQTDTTRLHRQLADVRGDYALLDTNFHALDAKYNALTNKYSNTSTKVNQLSADLLERERKLHEVENIMQKRDEAANTLKQKLQAALLGFQQSGLSVDIRNGKVYVSLADKLLFPSGSIVINDKGKTALKQLAMVLNRDTDINIAVEGHTDDQKVINLGQIKDNWDLSVLRATSVTRYLTEVENVNPVRLTATGKSQFQPVDATPTNDARAKNRRIEIVLSPKLDELYNLITK